MADTSTRWTDSLQFSSLFWPPPLDTQQRKEQITAYVDYFGQFTSEQFPEDIAELVRHRYPSQEKRLFDDVLATFVLHHPEHGHSVILPIISCIIDGTMEYDRSTPPFASFISLVCPSTDKEYSEQWALACGEILRVLTHYNRPILKADHQHKVTDRSVSGSQASTSNSPDSETSSPSAQNENKPLRLLSPWITDILLAAPLGIRSDYFRWCGGVMGKYAAGELKPPSVVMASRGSGKHPQLVPSTPRWVVANGAGVILSVCDEEVARYETATLTAAALLFRILSQPALLFPPLTQVEGVEEQQESPSSDSSNHKKQREMPTTEATIEATAQGIASMLCAHGPEVEWRICTIWEAAYGLIPLSSSIVDLPEIIVAAPLQPPILSWNLYIPLLKVLEYLPRGSPSEACLMKIFVATVEAILQRTFPAESLYEQTRKAKYVLGSASKNIAVAELRTMVHSLFLESCASVELASRLLFVVLTVCVSHEAQPHGGKRPRDEDRGNLEAISEKQRNMGGKRMNKQGPISAFDSYVLAAVCALSCELQIFPLISSVGKNSNSKDVEKSAKSVESYNDFQSSIASAVSHTRRLLTILEALFSLKPSSVGTSWGYSSNEIVAAAMVAAHISELFRQSKACMRALSVLMRCKWDKPIHSTASSLYNLIDIHSKTVASIVNKAEPREAYLLQAPLWKDNLVCPDGKRQNKGQSSSKCDDSVTSKSRRICEEASTSCEDSEKGITSFPFNASELANFLTMERHIGFNCSARILLSSVLTEKQELCFSVVSLLWHKLIASPETQLSAESTSAQQGWRQVVDALCNVVSASPAKAATAVVLQAERELQPWIAKDDDLGQKMWRINQRIVKLIVELMRNHNTPESLVIMSSALDLLLRATDGMLVDGEACTLPQLELLEATARAVQPVLEWGESGMAVADGLSNLLKCRLPATVRCLSHPSAHVRTLSTSVLRAILHVGLVNPIGAPPNIPAACGPAYQYLNVDVTDWESDVGKCLTWEAHSRIATGMPIQYLNTAAKELGCPISI